MNADGTDFHSSERSDTTCVITKKCWLRELQEIVCESALIRVHLRSIVPFSPEQLRHFQSAVAKRSRK